MSKLSSAYALHRAKQKLKEEEDAIELDDADDIVEQIMKAEMKEEAPEIEELEELEDDELEVADPFFDDEDLDQYD